jgi:hypothetical protein
MVRRHKTEAFERFLDEFRPVADKDSDWVMPWMAYQILANPHFARIYRIARERRARLAKRGNHEGRYADAGWLHRDYGKKGKNKWRVR